jgi:hypothetical protein
MAEWAPRAIVIVHGIGEQQRGTTRDGLVDVFVSVQSPATRGGIIFPRDSIDRCESSRGHPPEPPPEGLAGGEAAAGAGQLPEPEPAPRRVVRGDVQADVYEVYWAPATSHKTTARSVLAWLLAATFLPGSALRRPSWKTVSDLAQFFAYLLIGVFVLLVTLNVLGNLTSLASCSTDPTQTGCPRSPTVLKESSPQRQPSTVRRTFWLWRPVAPTFREIGRASKPTDRPLEDLTPSHAAKVLTKVSALTWLALMVLTWLTAQVAYRAAQLARPGRRTPGRRGLAARVVQLLRTQAPASRAPGTQKRGTTQKRAWQLAILAVELVLVILLMHLATPVLVAFVWVVAVVGTATRAASRFLAESLGDIQVYVTRDENNVFFAARKAVIAEAERVFGVVDKRCYPEVVVFGHSLGAVVAFDVLVDSQKLEKLRPRVKVFITFGSAREKVRYFFDRQAADNDERRELVASAFEKWENKYWLNVWYTADWVANPITTFKDAADAKKMAQNKKLSRKDKDNTLYWVHEGLTYLVLNLHRLPPPFRLFPASHSQYLRDPLVCELFTEVALSPQLEFPRPKPPPGAPAVTQGSAAAPR